LVYAVATVFIPPSGRYSVIIYASPIALGTDKTLSLGKGFGGVHRLQKAYIYHYMVQYVSLYETFDWKNKRTNSACQEI